MKRVIFSVIYIISVLAVATGIFLLTIQPGFPLLQGWIADERVLFFSVLHTSQSIFNGWHWGALHTFLLYALALFGGVIAAWKLMILGFKWSNKIFVRSYQNHRRPVFILFASVLLVVVLVLFFSAKEYGLRSRGYHPGSFYQYTDFASDTFILSNEMLADERGMTYFNPDSFRGSGTGMGDRANAQGFYADFDYTKPV